MVEIQAELQVGKKLQIIRITILRAIQTQIGMKEKQKRSWEMDAAMERIARRITACENEFTPVLGVKLHQI